MKRNVEECKSVLADLEKASGGDPRIDAKIWLHTEPGRMDIDNYSFSLDATIALVERVLPGATYEVTTTGMRPGASILAGAGIGAGAYATTPPLALLTALFRALIAQMEKVDG